MSALDDLIREIGDLLTTAARPTPDQQAVLQRYGGYQLLSGVNGTTNPPVNEGKERTAPVRYPGYARIQPPALVKVHHVTGASSDPPGRLFSNPSRQDKNQMQQKTR
jgi:hypothetical protein